MCRAAPTLRIVSGMSPWGGRQATEVEAQIQGDKLRVSGKKRDDLQTAIALLRKAELELPLQFENFRD